MIEDFPVQAYERGLRVAGEAHGDQKMAQGQSYVVHVANVAAWVLTGADRESWESHEVSFAVEAALLHDVLEDTSWDSDDLLDQGVPSHVVEGVQALTKPKNLDKEQAMEASLKALQAQPKCVRAVKLADRIVNLYDAPPQWSIDKRLRYADEAELIMDELQNSAPTLEIKLGKRIQEYRCAAKSLNYV